MWARSEAAWRFEEDFGHLTIVSLGLVDGILNALDN
jgi:hypothetical protein